MRAGAIVLTAIAICTLASCDDEQLASSSTDSTSIGDTTPESIGLTTTVSETVAPLSGSAVLLRPVLQCAPSGDTATPLSTPIGDDAYLPVEGGDSMWCLVGPAAADGAVFGSDATAVQVGDSWGVHVTLPADAVGRAGLDDAAESCYQRDAACPTGQLAITFGDRIVAVPTVAEPAFGDELLISGTFDRTEAEALAAAINAA